MNLEWPQLTYLALSCLAVGVHLAKHGEPRKDKYGFWSALISSAIMTFILYKGGFFN